MCKPVQQIQRITLDGSETPVTFTTKSCRYLVKNFSDTEIYVSFETPLDTNAAIKIPASIAQLCVANESFGVLNQKQYGTIYISGTGEVEVQQLWF